MKSNSYLVPLLAISASVALSLSSAHAQSGIPVYVPDFDTFPQYSTLSGQVETDPINQQWQTNDFSQSDYVGPIDGYRDFTSWGILGGLAVTTPKPYEVTASLFRNFYNPDAYNSNFSVDFAITAPTVGHPARDSFAWTFRTYMENTQTVSSPGSAIAGIAFKPTNVDTSKLDIYSVDYTGAETLTEFSIGYAAIYTLNATVLGLGTTPHLLVTVDPDGPQPIQTVIDTNLSALTPIGIGEVAAEWTLSDLTGGAPYVKYGSNSLFFQNYAVTVPEPGTWVLFGIGAGVVAMIRRRKTSKA